MRITIYEATGEYERVLRDELSEHELTFVPEHLSEANVSSASEAEVIGVFVNSPVTRELMALMPKLRLIVALSTGYDHIDLVAAKERGVVVCNVPSYGSRAVAEHAFALLLTISRRTYEAREQVLEDGDFRTDALQGFDLFGKTLGVIGTGKIGKNAARIGKGFGMNLLLCDKFPDESFASEVGGKYLSLDELCAQSDIITIHAPYMKENHHMISAEQFERMKKGVTIINTARGELIDTEALVRALGDGTVAHAGLDVLEDEHEFKDEATLVYGNKTINNLRALIADHVLIDDPRVVITPHIAFHSREADYERVHTAAENIKKFVAGSIMNEVK